MKKSAVLLILLLVSNFIFLNLVLAQELADSGLPPEIEVIQQASEQVTNEQTRNEYLKQEQTKLIEKSAIFGPVIRIFNAIMTAINPFFKAVLGVGYSLSWAFVFAVAIWLILFFILRPIMSAIIGKPIPAMIAAFAVTSLIGLSGVIKRAVDLLAFAVSNIWIALLSLVIAIVIMVILITLGGGWKKYMAKQKEEEAKRQEEEHREILKTSAEIEKKRLDEYKKG